MKKQTVKAKKVRFKYVIPDNLPDCHVNGIWGGISPHSEIQMHFFSERLPIPNATEHELNADNTIGKLVSNEKGGDIVRLIQASIIMDISTAEAVKNWLDDKINIMKNLKAETQ